MSFVMPAGMWEEVVTPAVGEAEVWGMCLVLAFVVLDVVLGLAKAVKAGSLSSAVMREGLWHKSAYVGVVALAVLVQIGSQHLDLGFEVPLVVPACVYIVVNEVISVVESLSELNPSLKGSKLLGLFEAGEKDESEGKGE